MSSKIIVSIRLYQCMEPTDEFKHWLTFMNTPELSLTQWTAQYFDKGQNQKMPHMFL